MSRRRTIYQHKRQGLQLSAILIDDEVAMGVTNLMAHTGTSYRLPIADATRLGRALLALGAAAERE